MAEEIAAKFILANGFVIVERNWIHGKLEIDIIAQNQNMIVFIEVKYRKNSDFGRPESAVDPSKARRIIQAADQYLNEREIDLMPRFDIIALTGSGENLNITHYPNAFRPEA